MYNIFRLMIFLMLLGGGSSSALAQTKADGDIRAYLVSNPQVILDIIDENRMKVLDILSLAQEQRQHEQFIETTRQGMKEDRLKPQLDNKRLVLGNPTSKKAMVIYSDFLCGYCANADQSLGMILDAFGDDLYIQIKHLPLSSEMTLKGATYVEALNTLNRKKAIKLYHSFFMEQKELAQRGEEFIHEELTRLGLSQAERKQIEELASSQMISTIVTNDILEAQKFKIQGTPAYIIDGVLFKGMAPVGWMLEAIELIIAE